MMEISSPENVLKFYARFDFSQDSKKTPKYTMSQKGGVLNSKMGIYLQEANIAYEVVSDTYDEGQTLAVLILENLQGRHNNLNFQVVDSAEYYTEKKYRQVLLFKIN